MRRGPSRSHASRLVQVSGRMLVNAGDVFVRICCCDFGGEYALRCVCLSYIFNNRCHQHHSLRGREGKRHRYNDSADIPKQSFVLEFRHLLPLLGVAMELQTASRSRMVWWPLRRHDLCNLESHMFQHWRRICEPGYRLVIVPRMPYASPNSPSNTHPKACTPPYQNNKLRQLVRDTLPYEGKVGGDGDHVVRRDEVICVLASVSLVVTTLTGCGRHT